MNRRSLRTWAVLDAVRPLCRNGQFHDEAMWQLGSGSTPHSAAVLDAGGRP